MTAPMMLEDEVEIALLYPSGVEFRLVDSRPCSRNSCHGHRTKEELEAIHEAIESCYAAARD